MIVPIECNDRSLPVELPHTRQFDLVTRDGLTYRLLVGVPAEPPPPGGFPLAVLVDGHALFPTMVATARLQAGRSEVTGVVPSVVLGIGYPGGALFDRERREADLLPVPGGADRFLETILTEMIPAVEAIVPLDPALRSLVGHSYGGLFTLHALFTRPEQFRAYVAGSPSIWWQDRAILQAEEAFRRPGAHEAARLLITVGDAEQTDIPRVAPERAARLKMARMRDNAAEMAARLNASRSVACEFVIFPGENHVSVIPSMLSRAASFALTAGVADKTVAA